jgi:PPOX class probable F420-dependent enzyme
VSRGLVRLVPVAAAAAPAGWERARRWIGSLWEIAVNLPRRLTFVSVARDRLRVHRPVPIRPPTPMRPYMPGYGTLPPDQGTGLLDWSQVEPRLAASHDYWLATVWADGRPHLMPVWGVWDGQAFWFSSSAHSRKVMNLTHNAHCSVSTDDPLDPVVLDGVAAVDRNRTSMSEFLSRLNAKYHTDYGLDFLDPERNATVRVRPVAAFALLAYDFTGSPTRWRFD